MNKATTRFKSIFLLLAGLALFGAALPEGVLAQTKTSSPAPAFLDITAVTVKPDMTGEFHDFIKSEFNPALVKGGMKQMFTWQSALGDAFKYVFVSGVDKMAEMDGPSPLEKGLGREAVGPFFKKAGTMVTSVHSYVVMERPDLSWVPSMAGPPKMAVVVTMKALSGRQDEFETFFRNEFLPAFKKSDAKGLMMHQTMFGGDPNEYVIVVPIDGFKDLDKGHPVARAIGMDNWKKMRDRMPSTVSDVSVMRLDNSLSIIPASAS